MNTNDVNDNETPTKSIDVVKFLKNNKLTDVIHIFQKRDITVEELIEFEPDDLAAFASDLGLDALQKNRFIKAIKELQSSITSKSSLPTSNNITKVKHIIISQEEHNAISKLYESYKNASTLIENINKSFISINKSEENCIKNIDNVFNELFSNLEDKKNEIIEQSDIMKDQKINKLNKALELLNEYCKIVNNANNKCKAYMSNTQMEHKQRKKEMLTLINNTLNHEKFTMILLTKPELKFTVSEISMSEFLNHLVINDCDMPMIPTMKILQVSNYEIAIKIITNKNENKKILSFDIEWCKLPKSYQKVEKIKQKRQKKKRKKKYDNSDTDSSDSDDEKSVKKLVKVKIKYEILSQFEEIEQMKWNTKASKKNQIKIKQLEANVVYAIRCRCKNDSDWSGYSIPIKIRTLMNDCWDKKLVEPSFRIEGNSLIKTKDNHVCAYMSHIVKKGVHIWKFRLDVFKSCLLLIGVWKAKYEPIMKNYYSQSADKCYCITMNTGNKRVPSETAYALHGGKSGDIIEMKLDLKKKNLSYKVNKKDYGVAFHNIEKHMSYRAAVSNYYNGNKLTFLSYECKS